METKPIKFVVNAVRWFDKTNGNTYHSNRIFRCSDGAIITVPFTYGYGDHYRTTALEAMFKAGWIKCLVVHGKPESYYLYERENNYPILWLCTDGLKRDCVENGKVEE